MATRPSRKAHGPLQCGNCKDRVCVSRVSKERSLVVHAATLLVVFVETVFLRGQAAKNLPPNQVPLPFFVCCQTWAGEGLSLNNAAHTILKPHHFSFWLLRPLGLTRELLRCRTTQFPATWRMLVAGCKSCIYLLNEGGLMPGIDSFGFLASFAQYCFSLKYAVTISICGPDSSRIEV